MAKYSEFAAMSVAPTRVISSVMYPNTYALNQVFFSETRAFMALIRDLERK